MLYLNDKISCKFLNNNPIVANAEIICIEFHQLKRKWLLLGCYKPPTQSDLEFIASRGGSRTAATCKMERFLIIVNG